MLESYGPRVLGAWCLVRGPCPWSLVPGPGPGAPIRIDPGLVWSGRVLSFCPVLAGPILIRGTPGAFVRGRVLFQGRQLAELL